MQRLEDTRSEDWRRDHDYYKVYDYLHDYVGCTRKQNLIDDLGRYLLRQKLEYAFHHDLFGYSQEAPVVTVCEPGTYEILEIGGGLPGDLFTDNMGVFFGAGGLFGGNLAGGSTVGTLKNQGGTSRTGAALWITGVGGALVNVTSGAGGTKFQLGSNTTAPARGDVTVGTAMATAPESGLTFMGNSSYTAGSGTTTVSGSLTSGGTGTINEATLNEFWAYTGNTQDTFCIVHDATTSTPFVASKSITIQWSIAD